MFTKTRTLLSIGVTSLVIATSGCVVDSSSGSKGDMYLDWQIQNASGQLTNCSSVGATTVDLAVQRSGGSVQHFQFSCSSGSGLTSGLASGSYVASVALLDASGTTLSQTALSGTYAVYKNETTDLGTILFQVGATPTAGNMQVAWAIETTSGQSTTCQDVGATKVDLDVQLSGGADQHFSFDCAAYGGISQALAPGAYVVAVRLYDANNKLMSEAQLTDYYAVGSTGTTNLGNIIFQVATTPDQFFYVNWVIHKCADSACATDQPGEFACPSGSQVVLTVDGTPYQAVSCDSKAAQTTTLAPGTHNVSIQLLSGSTVLSQFPGQGSVYPIQIQSGVPYGAKLIFAVF